MAVHVVYGMKLNGTKDIHTVEPVKTSNRFQAHLGGDTKCIYTKYSDSYPLKTESSLCCKAQQVW